MSKKEIQPGFIDHNKRVVNKNEVPWFAKDQKAVITFAPYPDHGRPIYLGSLIKTHPDFLKLAKSLNNEDSNKVNERIKTEIEKYLDQGNLGCAVSMTSPRIDRPDIHIAVIGNSYDENSLRLYYHQGEFMKAPAFYIDAIARHRDCKKVESVLYDLGGYQLPSKWLDGRRKN